MRDAGSILPATVNFRFQTRRCTGAANATYPQFYTKTINLADVLPDVGAGFSGSKWFYETALALYNSGGTDPTNKAALDALAEQFAKDYYSWKLTSFDETFPEIIAPEVDGLTDLIEWGYEIDRVWTRTMSAPYNDDVADLNHHDPANANCKDSADHTVVATKQPCFESYGPNLSGTSSSMILPVYRTCLVGDQLVQTYVRTDTINCGCGCDPTTTKVTFTVKGCHGLAIAGAIVAVSQGGVPYASGTTDSSGNLVIGITSPGTYDWTVDKSYSGVKRYATSSGSFTISACGVATTVSANLVPAPGFVCCLSNSSGYPYSKNLLCTSSGGSFIATWVPASAPNENYAQRWATAGPFGGTFNTFPDSSSYGCLVSPPFTKCGDSIGLHSVNFSYELACTFTHPSLSKLAALTTGFNGSVCTPAKPNGNLSSGCTTQIGDAPALPGSATAPIVDGDDLPKTFVIPGSDDSGFGLTVPYPGEVVVSEILP